MDVYKLSEQDAKQMLSNLIEQSYLVVMWPESQMLMEEPWFDECVLDVECVFGSSAFFVPAHRLINYYQNNQEKDKIE